MNPYLMLLACSCVLSAVCAGYVLARGAERPEIWLSTGILAGSSYWALCEVVAGMSPNAGSALWWLRASSVGWMLMGPLVVHMLIRVHKLSTPLERWLPLAYAASAAFLLLTFGTDTIMKRAVPTRWGWTFEPGSLHPLYYATLMGCVLGALTGERLPVAATSRAMHDKQGRPVGLVVSVRDLRELEILRSGLVTSARLAAVGQLAAGIAHEINNPLAFVRSNLNQLHDHWKAVREELNDLPRHTRERVAETRELIEESLEGVDRAAEIVRGVKGFSHADSSFRQDADLNALLDEVVLMATPQLRGRVIVERCYSDLPPLHAAPQQLKQVFLNIVVNGAQAAGDGGHLRIATHRRDAWVSVEISDDGDGIAPGVRGRIFEPFFTTKAVGEGTGLGLAIAYEIVRSHGGKIEVESQPGRGARFLVRLPSRSAG